MITEHKRTVKRRWTPWELASFRIENEKSRKLKKIAEEKKRLEATADKEGKNENAERH